MLDKINSGLDIFVRSEYSKKRIYACTDKIKIQKNGLIYIPVSFRNKSYIKFNAYYIAYAEKENNKISAFHFELIQNYEDYDINDLFRITKNQSNATISIGVLCHAYNIRLPQIVKLVNSTKVNGFKIQFIGEYVE